MTRFQLILPVAYHNVTKKLTGCTERVPIYTKLTIRPIAFRICVTCYRQKLTVWPGKSISCKKHLKIGYLVDTNLDYLTLEGPGRQTVDTDTDPVNFRPTPWGYDSSN